MQEQGLKVRDGLEKTSPNNNGQKRSFWKSINLSKTGILYILASIFQASWIYVLISNWSSTVRMAEIPFLGWAFVVLWAFMLFSVPKLSHIGIRLIQLSRDPDVLIAQTPQQKKKQKGICILLILGILADLIMIPAVLFYVQDKGAVVFLSGLMGGRVCQVNLEAILQYHNM